MAVLTLLGPLVLVTCGCGGPGTPGDPGAAHDEGHDHDHDHDHDHEAEHAAAVQRLQRAVDVTTRMLQRYRSAKSYTDQATYVELSMLRGEGVPREVPYFQISLALERPNRMRLTFSEAVEDASGNLDGFDLASDGDLIRATTREIPDQMVEKPAPRQLTPGNVLVDPMIAEKLLGRDLGDVFPQLAMLLNSGDDDSSAVYPRDSNPRLLDNQSIGAHDCYRVATSHPEGTRVFWIDAKSFALRRMELPVEAHRLRIDPERIFLELSVRIDFHEITFDAQIAPEAFALAPSAGMRRVRRFVLPATDETGAADTEAEAEVKPETEAEVKPETDVESEPAVQTEDEAAKAQAETEDEAATDAESSSRGDDDTAADASGDAEEGAEEAADERPDGVEPG